MNIFITDDSPALSARSLDDRRISKMCLETAQLLSTAVRSLLPDHPHLHDGLYKSTHVNHPSNRLTRHSMRNFLWVYEHGRSLCDEFFYRFDRLHKSLDVISLAGSTLMRNSHLLDDSFFYGPLSLSLSPFDASAFKVYGTLVENYRLTMVNKWVRLDPYRASSRTTTNGLKPSWTFRNRPGWYHEYRDILSSMPRHLLPALPDLSRKPRRPFSTLTKYYPEDVRDLAASFCTSIPPRGPKVRGNR